MNFPFYILIKILNLQFFSSNKKWIHIDLKEFCFPKINILEDRQEFIVLDTIKENGLVAIIVNDKSFKHWTAGTKNVLVSFNFVLILRHQCYVFKIIRKKHFLKNSS